VVVTTAVFSSLAFLLFWDGTLHKLDVQGGISILINLAILLAVLVFQWPKFDF
jgi:tetrahydromethanopterin S-methyltransferase subunit E